MPTPSMASYLEEHKIDSELLIWARGIEMSRFNPEKRSEEWRKQKGFKEEDVVITFVSRLVWEKNLNIYVDVLKKLMAKHKNIKALVVGDGPAGDEVKKMLPEGVYTGFLKGEELSVSYASSDVFFFPSDTETFGNVTLEAMASGLPCVVADAVGSKSLVNHEKNGFLAPVTDSDSFYNYIESLAMDSELRKKMAETSIEKAKEYSWENINGNLLGYYKQVLS